MTHFFIVCVIQKSFRDEVIWAHLEPTKYFRFKLPPESVVFQLPFEIFWKHHRFQSLLPNKKTWLRHRFLYNHSGTPTSDRFGDWRWFDVEGWRMESWPSPPYWNYVPLLKASEPLVVEGWKRREKGPCTLDNMGIFRKQWRVEAQVVFVQEISMIWRIILQVDRQEK